MASFSAALTEVNAAESKIACLSIVYAIPTILSAKSSLSIVSIALGY
ncbi:MAG: hypothetical protein ACK5LT_09600 [Lachnospirales bacterium]